MPSGSIFSYSVLSTCLYLQDYLSFALYSKLFFPTWLYKFNLDHHFQVESRWFGWWYYSSSIILFISRVCLSFWAVVSFLFFSLRYQFVFFIPSTFILLILMILMLARLSFIWNYSSSMFDLITLLSNSSQSILVSYFVAILSITTFSTISAFILLTLLLNHSFSLYSARHPWILIFHR